MKKLLLLSVIVTGVYIQTQAQFQLQGSASQGASPNCFILTPDQGAQTGAVWGSIPLNLNNPFSIYAQVSFGCDDLGADGIAFVMQTAGPGQQPSMAGGIGLGYFNISPSFAVEMDVFNNTNLNDLQEDHMSIMANGNISHTSPNNLVGPVQISATNPNVEDCNFHDLNMYWDPVTQTFEVYFDCVQRLTYTGNIVSNIFSGNPNVFIGFTAATGASSNLQQVCLQNLVIPMPDTFAICEGDTVLLDAGLGASFSWSPTIGLSDPTSPTPQAFPTTTTTYVATVTDNCGMTTTHTVHIDVTPNAELAIDLGADTVLCPGQSLLLDAYRPGPTYLWQDGLTDSARTFSTAGLYWVELTNMCGSNRDSIQVGSEVPPVIDLGADSTLCEGDTLTLDATFSMGSYLWQDGSNLPQLAATSTGLYWAETTNLCGSDRDSIQLTFLAPPPPLNFPSDTTLCDSATWQLDVSYPGATYLWQDNTTSPGQMIVLAGLYWAEVVNQCGSERDSVNVSLDQMPMVDLGADTVLCPGETLAMDASWTPTSSYLWQDGSTSPTFTASETATYSVTVSNFCGVAQDQIFVNYDGPPLAVNLGGDTVLCPGQSLTLTTPQPNLDHLWQDNSTQPVFSLTDAGTYWVRVTNNCGVVSDTIHVSTDILPEIDLGADSTLCAGDIRVLDATWTNSTYLWDDNSTDPVRTATQSGAYFVTVTNICGSVSDDIALDFIDPPQQVFLGNDTSLCEGQSLALATIQTGFEYMWQDGSTNPDYQVQNSGTYSLTVSNQCGSETGEIEVLVLSPPEVDLGEDQALCEEDKQPVLLDVSFGPGTSYLWQDGTSNPQYSILDAGQYYVEVSNQCGVAVDTLNISTRLCQCSIFIPTAFTPNLDGLNDEFYLVPYCPLQAGTLTIFDRWGRKVFESDNPDARWDGTFNGRACAEGVYVWMYKYQFLTRSSEVYSAQKGGTLTLLR